MAYRINQPPALVDTVQGGIRTVVWIGVGFVVVGVYLLLTLFIPDLGLLGSVVILVVGVSLLAGYFTARRGGWALYIGAILTAVGVGQLVNAAAFLPRHGPTAIAIGIAFFGISWVRRSAGRGGGWEFRVGIVALAYGVLELAVGLLPGSPGLLDLLLPILLLVIGALVVSRGLGLRRGVVRKRQRDGEETCRQQDQGASIECPPLAMSHADARNPRALKVMAARFWSRMSPKPAARISNTPATA